MLRSCLARVYLLLWISIPKQNDFYWFRIRVEICLFKIDKFASTRENIFSLYMGVHSRLAEIKKLSTFGNPKILSRKCFVDMSTMLECTELRRDRRKNGSSPNHHSNVSGKVVNVFHGLFKTILRDDTYYLLWISVDLEMILALCYFERRLSIVHQWS